MYDGQVILKKNDNNKIIRHGFGRYTDVIYYKFAVGYWRQDHPYGKQIVYKQNLENNIKIYKEGFFCGDWNKYSPCKILSSLSNKSFFNFDVDEGVGFASNDDGPHVELDFSEQGLISLKEDQLQI